MVKYIYILSIGNVRDAIIKRVQERLSEVFSIPLKIKDAVEEPAYAFNPGRGQYYSTKILKEMIKNPPGDGLKVMGITNVDLYTPVLTFVFGEAQLAGRAAVVSLSRLKPEYYGLPPDDELLLERTLKEVVHELGHTFGLTHCRSSECVMYLSNSVRNIDMKKDTFCPACHELIKIKMLEREG